PAVGLDPALVMGRLPHEFSGGQCQRICIARALVLNPDFIICDEPVSALDVSIRAQILNLLEDMKARFGLTLLFIAHDLAVVKAVSDRVAVMYLGRLCEVGPSEQLFAHPAHPYTALLIEAIPVPDPDVRPAESVPVGEPPSPIAPPSGCRFRTRCPRADQRCIDEVPELRPVAPDQYVVCHSDLHIWEGGYDLGHGRKPLSLKDRGVSLPRTMGHETVGEVLAFGPDVGAGDRGDLKVGDVALVYPWLGCGKCDTCLAGE